MVYIFFSDGIRYTRLLSHAQLNHRATFWRFVSSRACPCFLFSMQYDVYGCFFLLVSVLRSHAPTSNQGVPSNASCPIGNLDPMRVVVGRPETRLEAPKAPEVLKHKADTCNIYLYNIMSYHIRSRSQHGYHQEFTLASWEMTCFLQASGLYHGNRANS